jgi:DNA repair protein RadC
MSNPNKVEQKLLGFYGEMESLEMACGEQPHQRMENFGAAALSDTELIALMLHAGAKGERVLKLASQLIAKAGSIGGLANWHLTDFTQIKGIGSAKGRQLAAVLEIGRRMIKQSMAEAPLLNRGDLVAAYMAPIVAGLDIEKFWVLCLNRKNRLLKSIEISSGTVANTLVHPREVYRGAIRVGATAILVCHNHPSGDPSPSAADMNVTRQLREASKVVDIHFLDHVIVGRASADPSGLGFYSFRSGGLL